MNYPKDKLFLNLVPTCVHKVISVMEGFKTNKAPGMDNISVKTIKSVSLGISEPLCHLINIHKTGDKSIISNYRPISFITHCTKY